MVSRWCLNVSFNCVEHVSEAVTNMEREPTSLQHDLEVLPQLPRVSSINDVTFFWRKIYPYPLLVTFYHKLKTLPCPNELSTEKW